MRELSPRSRITLDNATCAYCHQPFDSERKPEEEHVIGRRFVPKGTLAAQWNLIVQACRPCNELKSGLENDISAITVRPDLWGREPVDQRRIAEARRKESARSRRTGKAVGKSEESIQVQGELTPGVQISANFVSGPQLDHERADRLAFLQVSAMFYWITYNKAKRAGAPIPLGFAPIDGVMWADWGNSRLRGFQDLIAAWPWRVHAVGADGYFKVIIRRHPNETIPLWAWALEWNQSYRTIGFFGDRNATQAEFDRLPKPRMVLVERGVDPDKGPYETRARGDVALAEEDDSLFRCADV